MTHLPTSVDSTLKANLSVGMPPGLQTHAADSFQVSHERLFEANDPHYTDRSSQGWGDAVNAAIQSLDSSSFG